VNTALMDNHQTELAEAMAEQLYCHQTTVDELLPTLRTVDFNALEDYPHPDEHAFPSLVDRVVFGAHVQ
jgi:UDP-N-acetylglucosamine transferase subunit ALG13